MMRWIASALLVLVATGARPAGSPPAPEAPSGLEALRHYSLGRLLEERGEIAEAITEYSRALSLDAHSASISIRLAELTALQGDAHRSLEFADRALADSPNNARALWLRGGALYAMQKVPEALVPLLAATRSDSTRLEYVISLARVGEQLERVDIVRSAYARATQIDEDDPETWFQLAAADARLGRFAEADSALQRSVDINPSRPGVFFLQGWIQESLGHEAKAIELYRSHLQVHAQDQVTRRRLVNLLVAAKRYPEAYREAQIISRARKGDLDAEFVEADVALYAGQTKAGLALLERLRKAAPDQVEVQGRAVSTLASHKRMGEAVAIADAWAAAHPTRYDGAMLSARARALAERYPLAVASARRAVELAPDSLETHVLLARVYQSSKRWSEAESVWAGVLHRFPESTRVALDLSFCREQMGDEPGAEQAVRDLLVTEPDNPSALNSLGYLLADHNRNLDEAEHMIRLAVDQEPDNGSFIDSLGWVLFRLGRLADARRELERAVALTGGDPIVREHLGDVYKQLRYNDLAREQYRLSLATDGSNQRVRAKLSGSR